MSIRFGVYDFFAYTIPGGLYLLIIGYSLQEFQLIAIDLNSVDFSLMQIILFGILAYVTGLVLDPIARKLWYQRFKRKGLPSLALEKIKESYPELEIKFRSNHWPVLLAYARKENSNAVMDIDRYMATNILLRNISFGFLSFSLIQAYLLLSKGFVMWRLVLGFAFLILSIIAIRLGLRIGSWFFSSIYEAVIAGSLEMSDLVIERESATSVTFDESGQD